MIEYSCKSAENAGQADNCHGWLRYRSSRTNDQVQKPFKSINSLPQMINEIVVAENEEPK
ncbi:MAG: hypothetical protein KJO91_10295 [Gammaproteobacteria bacterium]|nr:hypothetical protein [Gammaproteobacteria bacterium]